MFERDAYRCVWCSSWIGLCCDHVVPVADGGTTTIENLQTLCRPCNAKKGPAFMREVRTRDEALKAVA